jgi:polyhydroxyalkanoate synthesis regulator phasin
MVQESLENRVEMFETTMKALASLPDRVGRLEVQVLQLHGEMRDGFSAIRDEMVAQGDTLRAADEAIRADLDGLRIETRDGFSVVHCRIAALDDRMQKLNDEMRRHMLVLHEEVMSRIALIGEGRRRRDRAR